MDAVTPFDSVKKDLMLLKTYSYLSISAKFWKKDLSGSNFYMETGIFENFAKFSSIEFYDNK